MKEKYIPERGNAFIIPRKDEIKNKKCKVCFVPSLHISRSRTFTNYHELLRTFTNYHELSQTITNYHEPAVQSATLLWKLLFSQGLVWPMSIQNLINIGILRISFRMFAGIVHMQFPAPVPFVRPHIIRFDIDLSILLTTQGGTRFPAANISLQSFSYAQT